MRNTRTPWDVVVSQLRNWSLEEQRCALQHEVGKYGLKDLVIKVCQIGV